MSNYHERRVALGGGISLVENLTAKVSVSIKAVYVHYHDWCPIKPCQHISILRLLFRLFVQKFGDRLLIFSDIRLLIFDRLLIFSMCKLHEVSCDSWCWPKGAWPLGTRILSHRKENSVVIQYGENTRIYTSTCVVYNLKNVLFTDVDVYLLTGLRNPSGNARFLDFHQP